MKNQLRRASKTDILEAIELVENVIVCLILGPVCDNLSSGRQPGVAGYWGGYNKYE